VNSTTGTKIVGDTLAGVGNTVQGGTEILADTSKRAGEWKTT
jgi:hypothetical protein